MTTDPHQAASGSGTPRAVRPDGDEISLWEVLDVLLRRRGTIVLTAVLMVGLAVAFTLRRADTYTTVALFRPQGSEASASELMALASQFGVNVPGGGSEEASPAFYVELLTSREILFRVASKSYAIDGVGSVSLADVFEVEADTEDLRLEATIGLLRDGVVSIVPSRETGIVTVEVQTEWADLSQAIAERLLDEIARFNLDTRQSQAATERAFIQERVDSAKASLTVAESAWQVFLEENRQRVAPGLVIQENGLVSEVSLRQSVYTTLVQSLEQARISEVRDTPVITVLQAPFLPPGPDARRLLLSVALGIVLGGMTGVVLAFVIEAVKRPAPGDLAREDFKRTWEDLVGSIPFVGKRSA